MVRCDDIRFLMNLCNGCEKRIHGIDQMFLIIDTEMKWSTFIDSLRLMYSFHRIVSFTFNEFLDIILRPPEIGIVLPKNCKMDTSLEEIQKIVFHGCQPDIEVFISEIFRLDGIRIVKEDPRPAWVLDTSPPPIYTMGY